MISSDDQIYEMIFAGEYTGSTQVDFHSHLHWELILQSRGSCRHRFGNFELTTSPDQIIAIPPATPHRQESAGPAETLYLSFALPDAAFDRRRPLLFAGGDPFVPRLFRLLIELWQSGHPAREKLTAGLFQNLLVALRHATDEKDIPAALLQARHTLESRLSRPLSMPEAARSCGMSPTYFNARFRSTFGISPARYRQKKQLELAGRLLRDPRHRIADVARSCGFGDPNYFARRFRQEYGCSPSDYPGSLETST